jgi:hypothetical protein
VLHSNEPGLGDSGRLDFLELVGRQVISSFVILCERNAVNRHLWARDASLF